MLIGQVRGIRVLCQVVESGSFAASARALGMTQSAVSQHIHALEAYYGIKLFDRLHRKIQLTLAGEELYRHAKEMERQALEAEKAMRSLSDSVRGRLHIGASLTIGEYYLPGILVAFNKLYPDVDIAMDVCNSEQIKALVLDGQIDIGFIECPLENSPSLISLPWGGDELIVVAPASRQAIGGSSRLGALLSERWILREPASGTRSSFESFLALQGLDLNALNIHMELGSTQAVKEAVKAGLGITPISNLAVTDEVSRGQLQLVSLSEGPILRKFTCIYHQEKFQTHATEIFLSFIGTPAE